MPCIQVSIELPAGSDPESYERALLECGALSVTLTDAADQPVLEPAPGETPTWPHTRVTGLFAGGVDTADVERRLVRALGMGEPPALRVEPLEDRDWARAWMDAFRPMRFGRRLWICPEGSEPPEPGCAVLLLDPGLAFGTGTHPTTALCLEWLDAHPPAGLEVIDYGCGSGVLAVAAALLGARGVRAVDNDPQALAATRANAAKNGVAPAVHAFAAEALPGEPADVLLANIVARPLCELAQCFAGLVRAQGRIVLSGILESQVDALRSAYTPWFQLSAPALREGWARLEGQRK
ncbi:MAG: 50S ribosomal protein L11 methyltransferase [Gammaproteobacteria bacterium]|nr:50S ribosomal protein L11 methyltransferase [Gammaproteobacteria bacterium]NIR97428.1 50S ribosomal protein L11 methyltransferase [Gammaproteobacteria bacterium]